MLAVLLLLSACVESDPWQQLEAPPDPTPLLAGDEAVRQQVLERAQLVERLMALGPGEGEDERSSRSHAMAWAWARLGQVFHAYLRPADAALCYRNALTLRPDVAEWRYLLARTLLADGQHGVAADEARRALDLGLERRDTAYTLLAEVAATDRELDEARGFYDRALEVHPNSPAALRGLAHTLLQLQRPVDAEEIVRRALRQQPDASPLLHLLGLALRDQGRRHEATAVLARLPSRDTSRVPLVDDDPFLQEVSSLRRGAQFHARRARNALGRGLFLEAETEYRLALERVPGRPDLLYNLAAALLTRGEQTAAFGLLDELRAEHPAYRQGLALDLRRAAQFGRSGAAALEQEVLERLRLDPEDAVLWRAAGDAAAHRGAWRQAAKRYQEASRGDPGRPILRLLWLASLQIYEPSHEDLPIAAREAVATAPEHLPTFLFLVRLQLQRGDSTACHSPRLQSGPEGRAGVRLLETRALCARESGDEDRAGDWLRQARDLAIAGSDEAGKRRIEGRWRDLVAGQPSTAWTPSETLRLLSL